MYGGGGLRDAERKCTRKEMAKYSEQSKHSTESLQTVPGSLEACIKTISTAQARETDAWKTHLVQRGETAKRVVPKPELSSARRRAGHSRGSGPSKEGLF